MSGSIVASGFRRISSASADSQVRLSALACLWQSLLALTPLS